MSEETLPSDDKWYQIQGLTLEQSFDRMCSVNELQVMIRHLMEGNPLPEWYWKFAKKHIDELIEQEKHSRNEDVKKSAEPEA